MKLGNGLIAYMAGLVFALGLGVSGMTQPEKVIAFLDVLGTRGAWDPTLAFVMMSAVGTYALLYRLALARGVPLMGARLEIPQRRDLDTRLVVGAILFGVGWGLSGICPGPGLASLASGSWAVLVFVGAMVAGMVGHGAFEAMTGGAGRPSGSRQRDVELPRASARGVA